MAAGTNAPRGVSSDRDASLDPFHFGKTHLYKHWNNRKKRKGGRKTECKRAVGRSLFIARVLLRSILLLFCRNIIIIVREGEKVTLISSRNYFSFRYENEKYHRRAEMLNVRGHLEISTTRFETSA